MVEVDTRHESETPEAQLECKQRSIGGIAPRESDARGAFIRKLRQGSSTRVAGAEFIDEIGQIVGRLHRLHRRKFGVVVVAKKLV